MRAANVAERRTQAVKALVLAERMGDVTRKVYRTYSLKA